MPNIPYLFAIAVASSINFYRATVAQNCYLSGACFSNRITPLSTPLQQLLVSFSPPPPAWAPGPLHPPFTAWLTTLCEKQGQLTFFMWGSGSGSVFSSRFRKHLSVYFGPPAFTEVIITQSEVGPTHPVAQKGPMTSLGSIECYWWKSIQDFWGQYS